MVLGAKIQKWIKISYPMCAILRHEATELTWKTWKYPKSVIFELIIFNVFPAHIREPVFKNIGLKNKSLYEKNSNHDNGEWTKFY